MAPGYDSFVRDRLPPESEQPEFLFDLPELHYPERLNAAAELLRCRARETPAIVTSAGEWSYGDLDDLSSRIARLLVEEEGLVPGNRVLLRGVNGAMQFAAWLGILKAGGVVVATMPMLRAGEIATILDTAQVTHAIVDERVRSDFDEACGKSDALRSALFHEGDGGGDLAERLKQVAPGFEPVDTGRDDPALIAFTSGTTGKPKGCVHYHRDILASADTFARHILTPQAGARWACTAPLAFTFGLGMQFVFPLRFGGTAVVPAKPGPEGLLDAIEGERVNICATAPTAYRAMLAMIEDRDISSLTTCVSAGEHLPEATWREWKAKTGLPIIDGIGATEMFHIFISARGEDIRPGATGKAVPGYRACVLDEDGAPTDRGTGRLAVKGPTGCRYLADPRQADYVQQGWNVTGDVYRIDEDGYFHYLARADDMIISAGYNIAAPEVEGALYGHRAVRECAVVGLPCAERGQMVKAFVVLHDGAEAGPELVETLQAHVKQAIAPYKCPREIEFVDALPKTATGKLQRFALKRDS